MARRHRREQGVGRRRSPESLRMEPLRVLHVFSRMQHGGAELRTLDVMEYLAAQGAPVRMDFCALSGEPGALEDRVRELGGRVFHLSIRRRGFAGRFRRLLGQERFDVVHSHIHYASGVILRIAESCAIAERVAHFRSSKDGAGNTLWRRGYRALMRWLIDRNATSIVAVSRYVMETSWSRKWRRDPRCRVIYNGLNTERFMRVDRREAETLRRDWGIPTEAKLWIHVGAGRPPKNHGRLLQIFREVAERDGAAHLVLVGDLGPIERELHSQAASLGIDDRVVFAGCRDDVPTCLAAADGMIFPSLWEGMPGAVLEAAAAGIPVVASDLPGIREIAEHVSGVRCLSLDESDAVWAETIVSIQPSGESARRRASASFAAGPFCIARCAEEMLAVWTGVCKQRKAA
ncbi:MAG: glycosyltransferase family 1 protein [Planctomycetota bacterium]|nr:MAG: glycosyltransferase family 1 protein [Planctomycetota bacterium]